MHKSTRTTTTFVLLASSLVMLVIMPFLNQNNSFLSNVMAQEYDIYANSDYSTYQTDDKKYECRTGPFEGFFVSSVEFCKHIKSDDRKDHVSRDNNRTGTQGPPGPQGPAGPQGTQGPQGIQGPIGLNEIDPDRIYQAELNFSIVPIPGPGGEGFFQTITNATCNPGDVILQSGYLTPDQDDIEVLIMSPSANGNQYRVLAAGIGNSNVTIIALGNCFDNPPLRP